MKTEQIIEYLEAATLLQATLEAQNTHQHNLSQRAMGIQRYFRKMLLDRVRDLEQKDTDGDVAEQQHAAANQSAFHVPTDDPMSFFGCISNDAEDEKSG